MYIGIDIGGTSVRAVVSKEFDNPNFLDRLKIPNNHDFDKYTEELINFISKYHYISAIGISITGDLNSEKTMAIDASPNAPEFLNQPIVKIFKDKFNCQVFLENDGTVSALGEAIYGSNRSKKFTYLIWGTGIGGAKVTNNFSGKVNVEQIDWYKYFEAWENQCGGAKIQEYFGKPGSELTEREWEEIMKNFKENLQQFIDQVNPELIVFGGGVSIKQRSRLENLQTNFPNTKLQISNLGEDTGLYGALALIKQTV